MPFPHSKLIIATHNKGKLNEFKTLLFPFVADIRSSDDLNLFEPEETGSTFEENAIIKAKAAMDQTHLPCLADDSGLCVSALNGDPGIYSARWGGPNKDMMVAMTRVHNDLQNKTDRSAYFIASIVIALPKDQLIKVEGRVDGTISWPPRGTNGHGYDPIFIPDGYTQTFAEMSDEEKNKISHRSRALQKLIETFLIE